jgi:OPT family oligopeptide transporter
MSTQLIGFSIGGVARRFLVDPPSMSMYILYLLSVKATRLNFPTVWPSNLVYCALFNTLHSQQYAGVGTHGGMSRERFFLAAFVGSTLWYFVPGYLFTALSMFNWVCWIQPDNVKLNQLFGYSSGLGMSILTFDWSQIAYIGSPLATPWWAEANIAIGFVIFFWLITPAMYYANVWYGQYMPITSRGAFDNTGQPYDVTRILTPDTKLDIRKYRAYSPLYLSTTFAISYGLSFASITATVVHAFLYFRKQIYQQAYVFTLSNPSLH